mgnify:CR=1 FL=1
MTGTSNIRQDYRNTGGAIVKVFSLTVKISTAMADPRLAFAEVGSLPYGATKIVALGFGSGFNDYVKRFSPPLELNPNDYLALHGYGDLGTEIGFQYETSEGLEDKGATQF